MSFLLNLPIAVSIILVSIVSVSASVLGLKFVRKRFSSEMLKENHEVAGFIFNAFGLIYAVLVAFVVYVSWSDYNESKRNAEIEANLIADLFMDAGGLPDTLRAQVRHAAVGYTEYVISEEWNTMQEGSISIGARERLRKLWQIYMNADVKQLPNVPIYEESLHRLNDLGEYRRLRLISSNDFIPGVVWFVLIVCALSSVGYTFFFGTKNLRAQYVMTSVLTLINALIMLLILILDHPFQGSCMVDDYAFRHVLEFMKHMMAGG